MKMTNEEIEAIINDLAGKWADQIDIRNNAPFGSAKYNRAEAKADAIEQKASMLKFGDTDHTMSECVNG